MKTYSVYLLHESIEACHYAMNCTKDKYLYIGINVRLRFFNTRFLYLGLSMFISLVREMTYFFFFLPIYHEVGTKLLYFV